MDELQEKLTAYTQQLEQVAELEASDPSNAGFTKLRTDLEEVIRLTKGLIEEAKGTSALPAPEPAAAPASSAAPKFEAVPIGKWEPVAAPAPAPPDAPREGGKGGGGGTAAVAAELGSSTTGVFGVGARVEVLSADKWYPAVIDSVSEDGQDFGVTYMGYGTEGTATITTLRQITRSPRPVAAAAAVKGLECRALYVGDGTYYDCTIQEVTANGYKIVFPAYGNVEEVPLEYLQKKVTMSLAKAKQAEAQAEADASFAIPESLRLREGDSEAERDRKRKKVKALKGRFKIKQKDAVVNNKQASWQAFQTKGAKKKTKGSMAAVSLKKESIFASPAGLEGKVGVTGSGQGITEQVARKKHKTVKE
ncbi:conserved unknown protein [Ectocarpus siliculosus]|uniref:Tudor domain-containing protein n=1 Tax=Ectocarpus siliculosus TaxID=2880 RepID=D7G130_ECTSI|nr:conserved unknown protein [Ectocarpus siliculosus]|eukprot:CBJ33140.1 conserved unknown protein [Ectocarpus siliculosus]